jgi:hypothetical protein
MKPVIMLSAILLVIDCIAVSIASADDGPRLGNWNVVADHEGNSYPSKLVILKRTGNRFDGIMDYTLPNGPKWISVVSLEFDPESRSLRIEQRETITTIDARSLEGGTMLLVGKLDATGKRVSGLKTPWTRSPVADATWNSESTDTPHTNLVAAIEDSDARNRLYQQWSVQYRIKKPGDPKGFRILDGMDMSLLRELAEDPDQWVGKYARLRYEIAALEYKARGEQSKLLTKYQDGIPADIYAALVGTVNSANDGTFSLDPVKQLVNSKAMQARFAAKAEALAGHIYRGRIVDVFRGELMRTHPTRSKSLSAVSRLSPSYRIDDGYVTLDLRNTTDLTLHHCLVSSRLTADQQKMNDYEAKYVKDNGISTLFFASAGMEMIPAVEADKAAMLYHRMPKTQLFYVREWPPQAVLELRIARADWVASVGDEAHLWIGADEGVGQLTLDVNSIRTKAKQSAPVDSRRFRPTR